MPREEYIAQAVIDAMKQARIGRNLTQKELAKKMNVSVQFISQYETGKRMPRLETAMKFGRALRVPLWLLHPGYNSDVDGDQIKKVRESAGMTQEELAKNIEELHWEWYPTSYSADLIKSIENSSLHPCGEVVFAIAYILNVPWWTLYKGGDAEEDRADQASLDAYIASPTNRADTIIDCLNPDGIKKFLEYGDMLVSSDRYRKNVIKITPADSRFLTYFGGSPDAPTYPPFDFHKKDSDKK